MNLGGFEGFRPSLIYRRPCTMPPKESPAPRSAPKGARLYRGLSAAERNAQRRTRILEAGLELFGTHGYAGTSIRAVSAAASLNSRYFYESFTSREDLLYHVYQEIIREVATAVIEVTAQARTTEEQAHEGLRVAWTILTEDPRKARVIALEVVAVSERLERLRRENRHAFADMLVQNTRLIHGGGVAARLDPVLTARSLMGAVVEVLVDWINDDVSASVDQIVDHFTQLFTVVADAAIAPRE
jgi:AcrR family transcriptional regulator